jgi:hypothetical protein
MPKSAPASSTNHDTKECYPVYSNYNGMIEFSKALRCYYSESTAESRAQTYQPWLTRLKARQDVAEENINLSKDDMLTINTHVIELLNDTFKKEVNKNILLNNTVTELENVIIKKESYIDVIKEENKLLNKDVIEIKQMNKRYTTRLEQAEKNRKDPKHREQLLKFSLLILFGILLYSISEYL